jgi:cell volume regulation protein A
LGVDEPLRRRLEVSPVWDAPTNLKSGIVEVGVPKSSPAVGTRLLDLGLPKRAFVLLISRNGHMFVPEGSTVLEADDSLLIFTDHDSSLQLRAMFDIRSAEESAFDRFRDQVL